jgi:flagellar biosynthesis protein FlhG
MAARGMDEIGSSMNPYETAGSAALTEKKTPTLWAIGGGKGGVGKTVVTSSLAISFARRGHSCAVIDLDLGAANLHSLLGVAAPNFTLSDFLNNKVETLDEILCPTPYANLHLASGARASLEMANLKFSQKEKLLRHIRGLDYDHVILDISAGCAFNALDFFLAAEHRIAVVIPERTSVENTQNFLKTAFFRSLRQIAQSEPLRGIIMGVLKTGRVRSARDLLRRVAEVDAEQGRLLAASAAAFSPMLVINQLDSNTQRSACTEIALACRHYLSAGVLERGALPRDQRVRDAVAQGQHVLSLFPGAKFSVAVDSLASELIDKTPISPLTTIPAREIEVERGVPVGIEREVEVQRGSPVAIEREVEVERGVRAGLGREVEVEPGIRAGIERKVDVERGVRVGTERKVEREVETKSGKYPPLDSAAPGAYLRSCRERQGLAVADVVRRTRIRSLANIEAERFEELPPESYLAAFVRQYAQTLGIRESERLTQLYVERYRAHYVAS